MANSNFIKAARDVAEKATKEHADKTGEAFDASKTRKHMNIAIGLVLVCVFAIYFWWAK